jgi:hypothetical protein
MVKQPTLLGLAINLAKVPREEFSARNGVKLYGRILRFEAEFFFYPLKSACRDLAIFQVVVLRQFVGARSARSH